MYYPRHKIFVPYMMPIFTERFLEDEIPETEWLDFRKIQPGVFQLHFNPVKLKKSEVINLKRFFDRQIQLGQIFFYGLLEYEALEKYPVLRRLAQRAGFQHSHNENGAEFWQLYRE